MRRTIPAPDELSLRLIPGIALPPCAAPAVTELATPKAIG